MIKTAANHFAPILATGIYGLSADTLGTTLMIVMACAVIANQVWRLITNIRNGIRSPQTCTDGFASVEMCQQRHDEITRAIEGLHKEDCRQDALNRDRFAAIGETLKELKKGTREDVIGLHQRLDDVLRAVSRLEGKLS